MSQLHEKLVYYPSLMGVTHAMIIYLPSLTSVQIPLHLFLCQLQRILPRAVKI